MTPFFYLSNGYLTAISLLLILGVGGFLGCLNLRRRWRDQPGRLKWVHLGLSSLFCLAALTVPELYCALFYDQTDSFGVTNVSSRWFEMHVETNADGFRDRDFSPTLPGGQHRICFVGDSFTFGHGVANVDDRFTDRIARRLHERQPRRFAIANMGLPGADINDVFGILKQYLERGTTIHTAVYVFCPNDIERLQGKQAFTSAANPSFFLFRDTYFYNLMYYRASLFLRPSVSNYYSHLEEAYDGEPWKEFETRLDELKRLCEVHDVDLRIIVFPFLHNIGPDYLFGKAHQKLVAYCQTNGLRHLDLGPVFEKHAGENLTVNRFDAHPNEYSHKIAADAIRKGLLLDRIKP